MEPVPHTLPPADVAAVVRGDRSARERFFDHYYDRVFAYVVHTVRDGHLAEDLTHEIFLKLHRRLDRLDPERDPSPWVFTVAANAVRDHFRRRSTHVQRESVDVTEMACPPAASAPGADESLITDEDHRRVNRALDRLSPDDRQVILLREWEGLDLPTIARLLDIRPDAARQRWSRAVRRLGDAYRALGSEEVDDA